MAKDVTFEELLNYFRIHYGNERKCGEDVSVRVYSDLVAFYSHRLAERDAEIMRLKKALNLALTPLQEKNDGIL